ncbi:hypothetical protein LJC33_04965, partial [Eubacteriales bacterium OttesenSCG-928-N13]|nr:hypothetical protein [Eubacteriales bacterium OttesenSCG-928-N13]
QAPYATFHIHHIKIIHRCKDAIQDRFGVNFDPRSCTDSRTEMAPKRRPDEPNQKNSCIPLMFRHQAAYIIPADLPVHQGMICPAYEGFQI